MRGPLHAIALTRDGAALACRLAGALPEARAHAPARFAAGLAGVEGFEEPVSVRIARLWGEAGGFLLVMAAGIAVRSIAPLLADKAVDPAVVVLDPAGHFAVPLLSGHLGGANDLARQVAELLGATPVITTATDAAGRPAVEMWAREKGLRWDDRAGVVAVNAAWASGDPVGAYVDPPFVGLLGGLRHHLALVTGEEAEARRFDGVLFAVSHRLLPGVPAALWLRPPCLVLGVGCRKDADPEAVEAGVRGALAEAGLAADASAEVVSVDEKAREPALHALARSLGVAFQTYPAEVLAGVSAPTPSERVRRAVGTPSVSEAAAIVAAGGPLLLSKVKGAAWTLAVALKQSLDPPTDYGQRTVDQRCSS